MFIYTYVAIINIIKALDPFSPEVLYWSGQIHQKKQEFPVAIEKFREAISMAGNIPNYSVVNIGKYYNLLGLSLALNEQFEEGLQELEKAEKLGNDTAHMYIEVVSIYLFSNSIY
jgi:tetratricopeptide (TPR) repeat protein